MATFSIRGKNIEVTDALKNYVEKRVGKVTKYFDRVGEIVVLLTTTKGKHTIEVTMPIGNGVLLRGEETTNDMYTSIDQVVGKLERQIRKQKTKLQRRFRGGGFKAENLPEVAPGETEDTSEEYAIVKTKHFTVKPMDVQEAIMQMNMLGHNFFVFRNIDTEEICVVYRRADDNYGLIESEI